jgi:LysM repeat protein
MVKGGKMVNASAPSAKGRNFRLTPLELLIILLAILGIMFLAASWNSGIENARGSSGPAAPSMTEQSLTAYENSNQQLMALRQDLEQIRQSSIQAEQRMLNRLEAMEKRLGALNLAAETGDSPSPAQEDKEYVVKSGDSLGMIGEKFHIPVASLRKWNNIGPRGEIKAGQRLYLQGN